MSTDQHKTDSDGEVVIEDVPAGEHNLSIDHEEYERKEDTVEIAEDTLLEYTLTRSDDGGGDDNGDENGDGDGDGDGDDDDGDDDHDNDDNGDHEPDMPDEFDPDELKQIISAAFAESANDVADNVTAAIIAYLDNLDLGGGDGGGGDGDGGDGGGLPDDVVTRDELEDLVRAILDDYDFGEGGGGTIPDDLIADLVELRDDVRAALERVEEWEGEAGGVSEARVIELINEHAPSQNGSSGDGLSEAEVVAIVQGLLEDIEFEGGEGFDGEIIERVRHHAEALDFPARRVGPREPSGEYHANSLWGIHFRTGRECYIRSAEVDAHESGSFTAQLGRYDGDDQFDVVDETEIRVDEGQQRVELDLAVPEAGEYLLTRPGSFALRRSNYSGWDDHLVDGLQLIGGAKPGDYDANSFYYYYFNMELTANENHEFPE